MIRVISKEFGWYANGDGETLTIRTDRAREIAAALKDGKEYAVEIKKHTNDRSGQQNRMYWVILAQMAASANMSTSRLHNIMLQRYGQPMEYGDRYAVIKLLDTDEVAEQVAEDIHVHLKPTSKTEVGRDGAVYRYYIIMRGSSQLKKDEFQTLMDGLLDEARQADIVPIWEP